MASNIEIILTATDNTGQAISTVGKKLSSLGNDISRIGGMLNRAFTNPLQGLWKAIEDSPDMEKALEPINAAFSELSDELATALVPVIESLTPAFINLANALSYLIGVFSGMSPPLQTTIVGLVGLLAALGPLMMILGPILTALGSLLTAFGGLGAAVSFIASVAVPLLIAAFIPLTPVFQGLVVAVSLLAFGFYSAFMLITGQGELLKTQITAVINGLMALFKIFVRTVLIELEKLFPGIIGQVNKILTGLNTKSKEFISVGKAWMGGIIEGIASRAKEVISIITDLVMEAWALIEGLGGGSSGNSGKGGRGGGTGKGGKGGRLPVFEQAKGGSFIVPSGFPNDSFSSLFKLTSGERVTVSPNGDIPERIVYAPIPSQSNKTVTIVINYSPAVALGDRYEAEAVLAPMIQRALRGMV